MSLLEMYEKIFRLEIRKFGDVGRCPVSRTTNTIHLHLRGMKDHQDVLRGGSDGERDAVAQRVSPLHFRWPGEWILEKVARRMD